MALLVELVVEDVVVLDGLLLVVLEVVSELSPESLHADIKSVVVTRIGSSFSCSSPLGESFRLLLRGYSVLSHFLSCSGYESSDF